MTELDQIYTVWHDCFAQGESGVLATVVRVEGSTYRRAGARLLLTSGGKRVGSVSGGCLEADLVKKAWWLTDNGKAAIRKYDTTMEGDIAQEFGLGCNGIIHVLLERLETGLVSPLTVVPVVKRLRQPGLLATVIATSGAGTARIGQRWTQWPDGTVETDFASRALEGFARNALLATQSVSVVTYEDENGGIDLFVEPIWPTLRLLIFGGGDDAIPLVRLAKFMGYEVIVLDGRSHLARPERFSGADRVLVTREDDPLGGVSIDDWTAAVVMSHSYEQDLASVAALARYHLTYLGLLGPRKRAEKLLSEANVAIDELAAALHSPIGLDIGADGAEQIALAVIAEIQSVLNRRSGGRLREKAGPLHATPVNEAGQNASYRRPAVCPM
jgi:xanthine/CO dehydrogenase XdhC/CoxF family maturation factor